MNIIPNGSIKSDTEYESINKMTYGIDFEKGKINGIVQGKEAVKQYIHKIIKTNKGAYDIYTDYGSDLEELIGDSPTENLLISDVKREIIDVLTKNKDITKVYNFKFFFQEESRESLIVEFKVDTVFGVIDVKEVL